MAIISILHGPNLNLLGQRETDEYGESTLNELNDRLIEGANELGHKLIISQHNAEADLLTAIHQAPTQNTEFIIINPAAFTHTSIALRDALLAVDLPFIEVHISNIYQRESFRHQSYLSDIAEGVITGLGTQGYELALLACANYLS